MLVLEFKARTTPIQANAIDEAIRASQFIRNKALRYWIDNKGANKYDLNKYCAVLAKEFNFAGKLNSQARQAAAERAWSAISRFFDNCKKQIPGKKGFPRFKKNTRSVEYKASGWRLINPKRITFTDRFGIGELRLIGTWDLAQYQQDQIKRVRLVRRADGYYVQFCIAVDIEIESEPTHQTIGLDMGLEHFYTDSKGHHEPVARFYRQSQVKRRRLQRSLSRKVKGSNNRAKAKNRLARHELKVSRQRIERAKRLALCVIRSNDLIAYEDLRIKNMVRNHCLAKAIHDAGWYQFRLWLEYFGKKYGKVTVAVSPHYTSQDCPDCGVRVKKSLSTRTHSCACGCVLQRDHAAGIQILRRGLSTVGHTGTWLLDNLNAWGETSSTLVGAILPEQEVSQNQESHVL